MTATDFRSRYEGRRALVLGAGGFVGRAVARALGRTSATSFLAVREGASALPLLREGGGRATILEGDWLSPGSVSRAVAESRPDVVFDLVAYGVDPAERDPQTARRTNAELPPVIVDAVAADAEPRATVVHVGSVLELGDAAAPVTERSTPAPTTLYGRTKLAGTIAFAERCRERGVRGLTVRLFMVYGRGERRERLLPLLLDAARTGVSVSLTSGEQRRDFTTVDDVAEGLLRLALVATEPGTLVNLATGRLTSVREFCRAAACVLGIDEERLRFGERPTTAGDLGHGPVSVERLRSLVGWTPPTSLEAGIRAARDADAASRETR